MHECNNDYSDCFCCTKYEPVYVVGSSTLDEE